MNSKAAVIKEERTRLGDLTLVYRLYDLFTDERHAYSISISKYDTNGSLCEYSESSDITSIKDTAERIFSLVCEGIVTPMSLDDVLYDMIP